MPLAYRPATADDVPRCIQLRALTRHNAVSVERLASYGITADSWGDALRRGEQAGFVATQHGDIVGYCFGDTRSGEVLVLALLPAHEGQGVGRRLLDQVVERLRAAGHRRLFLGCSTDPATRSHGFYRHLGWVPTGRIDAHGDEILQYAALPPQPLNSPMPTPARVHLFPAHGRSRRSPARSRPKSASPATRRRPSGCTTPAKTSASAPACGTAASASGASATAKTSTATSSKAAASSPRTTALRSRCGRAIISSSRAASSARGRWSSRH